jgi:hypothetical protein
MISIRIRSAGLGALDPPVDSRDDETPVDETYARFSDDLFYNVIV